MATARADTLAQGLEAEREAHRLARVRGSLCKLLALSTWLSCLNGPWCHYSPFMFARSRHHYLIALTHGAYTEPTLGNGAYGRMQCWTTNDGVCLSCTAYCTNTIHAKLYLL